jgi:hypothetical protein
LKLHSAHRTNDVCQAAKNVGMGQDTLIGVFERIEVFLQRLELYAKTAFNQEMVDIIIKILVEVINILGIATKEIRQGRASKSQLCKYVAVDGAFLRKISK